VELRVKSKSHGTLTVCKDSSRFRLRYADTCEKATKPDYFGGSSIACDIFAMSGAGGHTGLLFGSPGNRIAIKENDITCSGFTVRNSGSIVGICISSKNE
jgi:hypothetical protein